MKFIENINNVLSVRNTNGRFFYSDILNNLYDSSKRTIAKDFFRESVTYSLNWLSYQNQRGDIKIVNLKDENVRELAYYPNLNTVDKEGIAFCTYDDKRIDRVSYWKLGKVNLHTGQLLAPNKFVDSEKVIHLNNEQFFTMSRKGIASYDIDRFELHWRLDLKDLGNFENYDKEEKPLRFNHLLGAWQGNLIVVASEHVLLSISAQTGEVNHIWHKILQENKAEHNPFDTILYAGYFVLDEKVGELIALGNIFFYVIDLNIGVIRKYDIKEEFEKYGIIAIKGGSNSDHKNPYTDTYIFTSAMMRNFPGGPEWSYDCVLAFNRKTHKIDWVHNFKEYNLKGPPKIEKNKLYQLDSNNTLHIFEDVEGTLLSDDADKLEL